MKDKVLSILKSNIYMYEKNLSYFLENIDQLYDVLQGDILKSSYKNNILITSEKIGVDISILVIIAINAYIEDLKNHSNSVLSNLESNQIVIYEGKKYKYINCEVINSGYYKGHEKIVLKTKNGTLKINKSDAYKISRYFGESEKLDKMEKNKNNEERRYLISKLLKQDIKELDGILNQQILVVFKSRKYMEEILSNLIIEVDGKKYDFCRVFPARYYSDKENYIDIKGNKFHSKPIFIFTSRFDVADLLLGENEDCKKLILLEEKSYSKSISIIEDYTLEEEQLDKIIFFNTYNHIINIKNLIEKDVRVYAIEENSNSKVNKFNNIVVESKEINSLLYDTRKQLIRLLKSDTYFLQQNQFIINVFKILKMYESLCIPICEFEEKYILDECINMIKKITENNFDYKSPYNKLTYIYENLNNIYSRLYTNNPKLDIIENISDKDSIIVLNNNSELKFIRDNKNIKYKSIEFIKNLSDKHFENEKLVFISFYDNKFISQSNVYNNNRITNIFYYIEAVKYNYSAKSLNKNLNLIYDNNHIKFINDNKYVDLIKLDFNEIILKEKQTINDKDIGLKIAELDNDKVIYEKSYQYEEIDYEYYYDFFSKSQDILDKNFKNINIYDYDTHDYDMKAYKKVIFKNNQFAYLTKHYKSSCIDIHGNYIVKNVDSLSVADKMIFTNDKSDEDIDFMFEKIINSDIFIKQYNRDFENVNYFKKVIRDYIDKYGKDYILLSKELSYYHIEKVPLAIKQWTENRIIGPREKEVYEAISKITRDPKLLNEWENIYKSSEIIRKFKSRFKSIFKHTVRSNMDENTDDEVIKLIIEIFDNLDDYVDIVEVDQIINLYNDNIEIQLNCLLDGKYILQGEKYYDFN